MALLTLVVRNWSLRHQPWQFCQCLADRQGQWTASQFVQQSHIQSMARLSKLWAINSQKAVTGGTSVAGIRLSNSLINSQRFHLLIERIALTALWLLCGPPRPLSPPSGRGTARAGAPTAAPCLVSDSGAAPAGRRAGREGRGDPCPASPGAGGRGWSAGGAGSVPAVAPPCPAAVPRGGCGVRGPLPGAGRLRGCHVLAGEGGPGQEAVRAPAAEAARVHRGGGRGRPALLPVRRRYGARGAGRGWDRGLRGCGAAGERGRGSAAASSPRNAVLSHFSSAPAEKRGICPAAAGMLRPWQCCERQNCSGKSKPLQHFQSGFP